VWVDRTQRPSPDALSRFERDPDVAQAAMYVQRDNGNDSLDPITVEEKQAGIDRFHEIYDPHASLAVCAGCGMRDIYDRKKVTIEPCVRLSVTLSSSSRPSEGEEAAIAASSPELRA